MGQAFRVLKIGFESRHELDREYAANLAHGTAFVSGCPDLLEGESVLVFVDLPFVGTSVELEGHVARAIPSELTVPSGFSGAAIELSLSAQEVRGRLEDAIGDHFKDERDSGIGRRVAPRSVAHVRVRVRTDAGEEIEGRTRDLSLGGMLVAVSSRVLAVGEVVSTRVVHPATGEEKKIAGVVARHALNRAGDVNGIGIQFSLDPARAEETIRFLNRIKASEHARHLGGISGSIDTLGLNDLLMSFGQCVPRGRFTLMSEGQIGTVQVANGFLVSAQMGSAIGVKALVRMVAWENGSFEFQANAEIDEGAPTLGLPIESAVLEAARLTDEDRGTKPEGLEPEAGLWVMQRALDRSAPDLTKLESQVVDLAQSGTTVSSVLDRIQEPDLLIERSIADLAERGLLMVELCDRLD